MEASRNSAVPANCTHAEEKTPEDDPFVGQQGISERETVLFSHDNGSLISLTQTLIVDGIGFCLGFLV
jgi:hypothetical protein